jgi:lipopolysaccharide transport system permease protein
VFISEGEWVPLREDVPPGASATVELAITLPEQRGSYLVYVSPVLGTAGWLYMKGSPLLALDVAVGDGGPGGGPNVTRTRVTTVRALQWSTLPRWLRSLFVEPVRTVVGNWNLIGSMARRDIHGRYRGSVGDMFWAVLNPLLLTLTYAFVFGVVLQARYPNDKSPAGFVLYFLAGMMPWLPVSEALARAPQVVIEYRNFVKKLLFPIEIIPVTQTVSALVTQSIALVFFVSAIIIARDRVPYTVMWFPVLLIPQILLMLGLSWFLAGLGAFLRDLGQIMGFALTLWFFLTPICYPEVNLQQNVPLWAMKLLAKNPIYILVLDYRRIFLENRAPVFESLWRLYAGSILVFLLGHAWFRKLKKSFADVI